MSFIRSTISFIFSGLGFIILAIIGAFGMTFLFSSVQLWLSGEKNYLLFISNDFYIVSMVALGLLIAYLLFFIKSKFTKEKTDEEQMVSEEIYEEEIDEEYVYIKEDSKMGIFMDRVIQFVVLIDDKLEYIKKTRLYKTAQNNFKITCIVALIIITYCGFASYTVLYESSIKVSSPLAPFGVTYKYSDIKKIKVGVKKGYQDDYDVYYILKFNNDKAVDLLGGAIEDWDGKKSLEGVLIDIDKQLKVQGVSKSVDKNNFEKFSNGLDKEYVSETEKLFE